MTSRIDKALLKMRRDEREWVISTVERIRKGDLSSLDVKKVKGRIDEYRVRKGKFRILFRKLSTGLFEILDIDRRSESTYR